METPKPPDPPGWKRLPEHHASPPPTEVPDEHLAFTWKRAAMEGWPNIHEHYREYIRLMADRIIQDAGRLRVLEPLVGVRMSDALENLAIYLIRTGRGYDLARVLRGREPSSADAMASVLYVAELLETHWEELGGHQRYVRDELRRLLWRIRGERIVESWRRAGKQLYPGVGESPDTEVINYVLHQLAVSWSRMDAEQQRTVREGLRAVWRSMHPEQGSKPCADAT